MVAIGTMVAVLVLGRLLRPARGRAGVGGGAALSVVTMAVTAASKGGSAGGEGKGQSQAASKNFFHRNSS